MSNPRTTLLFDLDGTLVHSLPDIAASANHVRGHYGLSPVDDATVRTWIGDGLPTLLQRALQGVAAVRVETAMAIYREHHVEQCTRLVAPFDGVVLHLERWRDAGHPMAVVTNKPEHFSRAVLDHLDLTRFFGVLVGGDTTGVCKPDPAPVREALRRLGVDRDALMVGDSPGDVLAGQRAGVRTAAVLYGYRSAEDLRAVAPDECWSAFGVRSG